ncbi:MAG TPA: O-antigen ligase family protein [Candidatus Microbacterium pullistercoris]|nr:O-antigen ligase family protein [Candidatus Microbacterium pullistercoris]
MTSARGAALTALADLLRSAAFARAYTLTALAAAFLTTAVHSVNGPVTLATIVAGLAVLGVGILVARRDELSLIGFAPTSLVLYVVWAIVSLAWALDGTHGRTVLAWCALIGWSIVAVTIAHVRDTLQIARAVGDVLRWLLTASLALEVLSGIIFDTPFVALGIEGLIANGGPIQGLFGSRNLLAFVAVVGLITFTIEWRARAIARHVATYSLILASLLLVLSGSPTAVVLVSALVAAELALAVARRSRRTARRRAHVVTAVIAALVVVSILVLYRPIAAFFAARSGFAARAELWSEVSVWIGQRPVTGWSFFGTWEGEPFPTNVIDLSLGWVNASALNVYVDIVLQLGWVGLLLFATFSVLALARAWLAAADRRSVVYAWLPLMLVALLVESLFESYALGDLGWLLLVVCAVRAGQERSWRVVLDPTAPLPAPPIQPPGGSAR